MATIGHFVILALVTLHLTVVSTRHIDDFSMRMSKKQKTDPEGYRMGYIFGKRSQLDNDQMLKAFSRQTVSRQDLENLADKDPVIAAFIYRTQNGVGNRLVRVNELEN